MTEEIPVKDNIGGNAQADGEPAGAQVTETRTDAHSRARRGGGKAAHRSTHQHSSLEELIPFDLSREEALQRMEVFYRLTRLLNENAYDIKRMTASVSRLVAEMVGDMSVMTLLNADGETYNIAAYHDPDPAVESLFEATLDEVARIPRSDGWVAGVIATGQPLLVRDITVEQAIKAAVPSFTEFTRQVGIAGMLIVPIKGRSGVLGTIAITRHSGGRPYTENDQSFLMEVAYRMGIAVENCTLVESLRREIGVRLFAGEALAASEERFLSIFRSAASGIKVMDLVGTILETNPAFQAMTGYSEPELIAMHFYDIVHPEDIAKTLDIFDRLKTGREAYARLEHRLVCKDGSIIWVNSTYAAVRKGAGDAALSLVFGIAENITERKKAEKELLELKQHLQHSIELDRLKIAQNLHDAPLQELYAVIYKLEEVRLKTDPGSAEMVREAIVDIKKTLESLRTTASELRPPSLSRFGLEKAIRSYGEDFKVKHPNIQLKLVLARDQLLLAEPVRLVLFRVFQESLANAARHARASEVQVRFSFDAEEARIEISDNGKGFDVPANWMTEARMGHYGLAGMQERVSAAGGVLALESSPDSSTTVRAIIPCLQTE